MLITGLSSPKLVLLATHSSAGSLESALVEDELDKRYGAGASSRYAVWSMGSGITTAQRYELVLNDFEQIERVLYGEVERDERTKEQVHEQTRSNMLQKLLRAGLAASQAMYFANEAADLEVRVWKLENGGSR